MLVIIDSMSWLMIEVLVILKMISRFHLWWYMVDKVTGVLCVQVQGTHLIASLYNKLVPG